MQPNYDDYLADKVEEYMEEMYCEPKIVKGYQDEDGGWTTVYNCEDCDNEECDYFSDWHDGEPENEAERQAEMDESLLWDI